MTVPLLSQSHPIVSIRALHLDLKGVPPTPDRLLKLLPIFKAAGYNALLVEWEDMFPWTVDQRYRCETAYEPALVTRFHAAAAQIGLEIIPLVQCLGHMETALTPPEYEALREHAFESHTINALAPGAGDLVRRMVDDVLALTEPKPRYFHLGGDEAWTMGTHPDTKAYIEKHGKAALYLQHVQPLLDHLNSLGIRPILWHDMMKDWPAEALKKLAQHADLMAWGYGGTPQATTGHHSVAVMQRFKDAGVTLWGGAAYKGADGGDADLPNLQNRQTNALGWAQVSKEFDFVGIAATAWSRYATHTYQCEPIDAALDVLVYIGVCLHDGQPPVGGMDACVNLLDQMGEKSRFQSAQQALTRLRDARRAGWSHVRELRQWIVMATQDARRRSGSWDTIILKRLRTRVADLDAIAQDVQHALQGAIDPIWVDRYLAERIEPLREELAAIEPRIRQLNPQGYRYGPAQR